jgi:serine/threonine protein kinase
MEGPPKFPSNITISPDSMNFILQCLTVDTKKRITWKAIYEHPLLQEKKNSLRNTYVKHLNPTTDIAKARQFYMKHSVPNMAYCGCFSFPKA